MSQLPTLIRIRERDLTAILDLTIAVIRREPWPLLWSAALGMVPCAFATAAVYDHYAHDQSPTVGVLMFGLSTMLLAPCATAPLTIVLGRLMFGHKTTVVNTIGHFVKNLPAFLVLQVLFRAMMFPVYPLMHAFLNEVIFLENQAIRRVRGDSGKRWRPGRCLKRSAELCRSQGNELISLLCIQWILGSVFLVGFWMATGTLISAFTSDVTWEAPWLRGKIWDWRIPAGVWIVIEFFAIAKFLTYVEFRNRREGWEIALRLKTAGQALEERRKW